MHRTQNKSPPFMPSLPFTFFLDANQSDENQINSTVNDADDGITTTNNGGLLLSSGYNTRKSKKRKRHFNLNKNKQKWNKSYKRQKSTNTTKPDAENISQNGRNKHAYAKATKTAFHSKQTLHRGNGLSKFFLPDKRPRKDIIVPATKFLLGGKYSKQFFFLGNIMLFSAVETLFIYFSAVLGNLSNFFQGISRIR